MDTTPKCDCEKLESYETITYTDERGFSVRETSSEDGKSLIITRERIKDGYLDSEVEVWHQGKKLYEDKVSKEFSVNEEQRKKGECLKLFLIIILIIIFVIIGVILL